jgi:ectoine hydroxylase-related dioxygenase (phytanoyl-CoA dioxygenase family)
MKISGEERLQQTLSEETLAIALRTLRDCGYVALEAVLPRDWVEEMRLAFDEELEHAIIGKEEAVAKARGHHGISAPLRMPFLDPLAIDNPFARPILEAVFGKSFFSYLPYGCNTAWPGSGVQHLHRDTGHLFPETPHVLPMTLAVVNIPLVEFTLENGATEVWPGSHRIVDSDANDRARAEERAAQLPSVRLTMPAGSVVVRDMRCWHRGMPNRTGTMRTMTAMVYFRQLHHLPDDPKVLNATVPRAVWEQLSERTRSIYRYHPVSD